MSENEDTVWSVVWPVMEHRQILDVSHIDPKQVGGPAFGALVRAYIGEIPEGLNDAEWHIAFSTCPVCGEPPTEDDRVVVAMLAEFAGVHRVGLFAWAHSECFEMCPVVSASEATAL